MKLWCVYFILINIDYIKNISVVNDVKIMFKTVKRVIS